MSSESRQQCLFDSGGTRCVAWRDHLGDHQIPRNGRIWFVNESSSERETVTLRLDKQSLLELMDETREWQAQAARRTPDLRDAVAQGLLQRWLGLQLALPGGPYAAKGRTLPRTREELAGFFGDIRDDHDVCVTGSFVEMALQFLTLREADADKANVDPEHKRRVDKAEIALARGVKELRDVMDGRRGYDEDGTLLP